MNRVAPYHGPAAEVVHAPRLPLFPELAGMTYLVVSVGLSFAALNAFGRYTSSDFFVADFDSTTALIVQSFNTALTTTTTASTTVDMTLPTLSTVPLGVNPAYPRLLMYSELTTLPTAIQGLRRLSPSLVVKMVSLYCWVDLGRRWELAYSATRQARCSREYAENGAMYLESVLRNIPLTAWLKLSGSKFEQCIGLPIRTSGPAGLQWYNALLNHTTWSAMEDEIALWRASGLRHFTLQYGTGIGIGVTESIAVTNALGVSLALPLKAIPMVNRWVFRTTLVLNDLLYNDLWAIAKNTSLVRSAPNYFGLTHPFAIEAYAKGHPLNAVYQALHDQLGPLGNIDAIWVPPPRALVAAVTSFRTTILAHMRDNASVAALVHEAASRGLVLTPTPVRWQDPSLLFYGGNPMCGDGSALPFVQQTFGFDDVCGAQRPLTVEWQGLNGLFAYHATHFSTAFFCSQCPREAQVDCVHGYAGARRAIEALPFPKPSPFASNGTLDLSIELLQMVQTPPGAIAFEYQPLLEPTWSFFGCMMLYDWVLNHREVLSMQGDVQERHLISSFYAPRAFDPVLPPAGLGPYLLRFGSILTFTLALVGLVAISLWLRVRPRGTPWLAFWPVAGSVWVSRNLLLVRGVMATICLASVPVQAMATPSLRHLAAPPRPWYLSCLLASESLWLVYCIQDLLLPYTYVHIRATAPYTSLAAWLIVVALDQGASLFLLASIDRSCYLINMDNAMVCKSGSLQLGWPSRALLILGVHSVSVVLCVVWTFAHRDADRVAPHKLLPLSAVAPIAFAANATVELNDVGAWVAGMVYLRYNNVEYIFDCKLWRLVSLEDYSIHRRQFRSQFHAVGCAPLSALLERLPHQPSILSAWWSRHGLGGHCVVLVMGITYMVFTLLGNVAYLKVLQGAMANDFGWASFNTSGTHAFLANLCNRHLLSSSHLSTLELESRFNSDLSQSYATVASATISWYPTIPRRQLFAPHPVLADVIRGLRSMDPAQLPWMFTQYCWLDLNRTWSMASTPRRQARCASSSAHNGARYLETSLRNVRDWDIWWSLWGDSYYVGIQRVLDATLAGRSWQQQVRAAGSTSILDEVAHWQMFGITTFLLQWQNYKATGFQDALVLTTALNLQYHLPLSHADMNFDITRQTSMRMYWGMASDLWAIGSNTTRIAGLSLLASSPAFAFANTTPEQLLFDNYTLVAPLSSGLASLQATLGPFNVIDMVYVPIPSSLQALYAALVRAVANLTVSDLNAQAAYLNLPIKSYIGHVPSDLLSDVSAKIVGGNIFCGDDIAPTSPYSALAAPFSADSLCHAWRLEYLRPSTTGLLLALLGYASTRDVDLMGDLNAFCSLDVYAEPNCMAIYAANWNFTRDYMSSFMSLSKLARAVHADVEPLNIRMLQYVTRGTQQVELYERGFFDASWDRTWPFFGWCYLYEWAIGQREVVSFQGDVGVLTTISTHMNPVSMTLSASSIPTQLSYMCQQCARYVTGLCMGVTGLLGIYGLSARGAIEGLNLFEFNRIVGHVWVGRTLLVVRSLTALWLLNTSTLTLGLVGSATCFTLPPLPWTKTVLAASELTWLNYILNDLLSFATERITIYYAWKSTLCTWLIAVIWTIQAPQHAHVQIGSFQRVLVDLAIVLSSVLGLALIEWLRLRKKELPNRSIPTLLLSSSSLYMLELDNWTHLGECFLDQASGVLAGLLTLHWHEQLYVFDIKSWRFYTRSIPATTKLRHRFRRAIPLTQFR
ncbi:hypothetical protein SPRG_09557 [Saprolegnia parasitica CBS 223.65]|uniref:Uncharacterized protein n=1 Tax=Saprolegnia parasitica (strain CBS 223.65) TaxID=695850 RepID=A0A067C309_SAPPC|nr:hypothetical protein SPRG_09557 [Saprolegnia parasitica CBS 223.65]KDO24913.1 hypothetical protein SPRG_09557 [Saprolegnia parasitica CBS 223.65]|eukprot:XP_012204373.1 hypothetical protein SPRG_09557 [Saprolegnia parasitica CBS 223.65]